MLPSDGAIRWLGEAVGKLVAGDEVLKPRVRIIADEQLTGAPRDAVQARLDLWLKTHIEKLLGPLFELAAAEDVTGIARGIAFQLVEALGVLERSKVAEDVKGLDQPARAGAAQIRRALRRLSPLRAGAAQAGAARARGAALGAQARRRREPRASTRSSSLAASGRTSIAADKEIDARRSTASSATASAASARCASTSSSGSPT